MRFLIRNFSPFKNLSQRIIPFSRITPLTRLISTNLAPLYKIDEELQKLTVSTGSMQVFLSDADLGDLERLKESLYKEIRLPQEIRSLVKIQAMKERIESSFPISHHSMNILLRACTFLNDVDGIKRVLRLMRENNIKFNSITYLILANYYQSCRYPFEAERVIKDAESKGFKFDHRFATILVRAFSKVSLEKSEYYFNEAISKESSYCKPDVWLYNAMICAYIDNGFGDKAEQVMERMNAKGLFADEITLKTMILGYLKVGNLKKARHIWDSLASVLNPPMKTENIAEICVGFWGIKDAEYGKKILLLIDNTRSHRTHTLICDALNRAAAEGDTQFFMQQYEKHCKKDKAKFSRALRKIMRNPNTTDEIKQFITEELDVPLE